MIGTPAGAPPLGTGAGPRAGRGTGRPAPAAPGGTGDHRSRYLALLADADEDGAIAFAHELLDRGIPAEWILLGLVGRSQAIVGARWAANEWSVAQEHAATHVSDRVVAAVSRRIRGTEDRGDLVVACVDGEWHSLPARIFAEVMRLHGWRVRFLGASVPAPHLISYLHQHGPDAVAVSCALPTRLVRAHRTIEAAQGAGVPVLAGGRGFSRDGRWALKLGADAAAGSPAGGLRALAAWPPRDPPGSRGRGVPLDDEHTLVAKKREDLVDTGMAALESRFPPLRDYSAMQRDHTWADLAYIVDFLSAGLFVDDAELFTDFVGWLTRLLAARRVPVSSVDLVLAAYHDALYDFPRARNQLTAGREVIAGQT